VTDVLPHPHAEDVHVHRLAEGTELVGEFQDSAFDQPKFLVQRADGQVMQLPALLYRVVGSLDGRTSDQIAAALTRETGQELTGEQVSFLIEERLRPVGVIASARTGNDDAADAAKPLVRSDPLLALRYRAGVIPAELAYRIAGVFQPFFARPAWIALLTAFVAVDAWILTSGNLLHQATAGIQSLVRTPALVLLVLVLTIVSGAFHEWGHISACRYGGARPGDVGIGIYIVWPAFYSTVTDSYRLDRAGRLRTDLGGLYFDAIFMAGLGLVYLRTGEPWLLIALVGMHTEAATQLLPSIRLDGYYILADLVGVPDLFGYVKPTLLSVLPGRPTHPKVRELKQRARRVIVSWVLMVVPILAIYVIVFLIAVPRILPVAWRAMIQYLHDLEAAARAGDVVITSLSVFQLLLLVLPWVGSLLMLRLLWGMLRKRGGTFLERRWISAAGWGLVRRTVVWASLLATGALLVLRVAQVAVSHPATTGETRLIDSALATVRGVAAGPVVRPGEVLAREQLVAYARLTGAFERHTTVLAAGRELAVLACAILIFCLLTLVATGRVRPLAVALPLLAALAMGPVVTTLATIGPGVLGVAWTAVGGVALLYGGGRLTIAAGVLAIAVGVATQPLLAVPLLVGTGVLLAGGRVVGPARRRSSGPKHAQPRPGAGNPRWWVVAVAAGIVAAVMTSSGGDVPLEGPDRTVLLLVCGLVVAAALLVRGTRVPAAGAVAGLVLAALPWPGAGSALPVALVAVLVLAVLLIEAWVSRPPDERPHPLLRALVALPVLVLVVVGALFTPETAPQPSPAALAEWITGPASGDGAVVVPAGLWGDLVRYGVPAERLARADSTAAAAAEWQVVSGRPVPGAMAVAEFGSGPAALTVRASGTVLGEQADAG
jgi:putative peptide zinc metalloprotease protein